MTTPSVPCTKTPACLGCLEGCLHTLRGGSGRLAPSPLAVEPRKEQHTPPKPVWPKKIYLVRHGQSEYNVHYEEYGKDPMNLWDAPLTSLGREQATALQPRFAHLGHLDLAVASPLTRALQTCQLALPPSSGGVKRYEITPLCAEHLEASCDIGRPASELAEVFKHVHFDGLPEVWWWVPDEHRGNITAVASQKLFSDEGRREPATAMISRVDAFAKWLASRPEASIAVFGHADFFHQLLARHFSRSQPCFAEYWMRNCELLEFQVNCEEDLQQPVVPKAVPEQQPKDPANQISALEEHCPASPAPAPSAAALALKALKEEIALAEPDLKPGQVNVKAARTWGKLDAGERARRLADALERPAPK